MYVELDCASLKKCRTERRYRAPSDFPSIQRDVTLVVKADEFASHISKKIEALKPADLHWAKVVDDFQRDGEDIRRTTFRLEFQSQSRTLEHSEVDRSMASILDALKGKHSRGLAE